MTSQIKCPSLLRCFDESFPRGALVYHHPLFQRDRPELMNQMTAGKNKCEPAVSKRATVDRELRPTARLGQGSILPPTSASVVCYDGTAAERLDTMQHQQQQQQLQNQKLEQNQQQRADEQFRVATTIHARMQSNAVLRELCLQSLHDRQQQRAVDLISDPSAFEQLTDVSFARARDMSSLLQLLYETSCCHSEVTRGRLILFLKIYIYIYTRVYRMNGLVLFLEINQSGSITSKS